MFKKFNWGHGIFIFYVCFVGAVVTALVASFGVDHSLVVDDYYAQDLAYQTKYTKTKNSIESDRVSVSSIKSTQTLIIEFTHADKVEGFIDFYRPSDKSKDFKLKVNKKETIINTDDLLPGKWILKIDWVENGKPYYKEEIVFI